MICTCELPGVYACRACRWNALGLQGGLLSILVRPLFLSSVVVGRRFSKPHCERALCCRLQVTWLRAWGVGVGTVVRASVRLWVRACGCKHKRAEGWQLLSATIHHRQWQDFTLGSKGFEGLPPAYGIRHPAMLCTSVKMDNGLIDTSGEHGRHADFTDQRCLGWSWGDALPELLDGSVGAALPAMLPARCSSVSALHSFLHLCAAAQADGSLPSNASPAVVEAAKARWQADAGAPVACYRELKARLCDPQYRLARDLLVGAGPRLSARRQ